MAGRPFKTPTFTSISLAEINGDDLFANNPMISKEKVAFSRLRIPRKQVNSGNARMSRVPLKMYF